MASTRLTRTNGTPTDTKKMTFSTWFKIGTSTNQQSLIASVEAASGGSYTDLKIMNASTHKNVFRFECKTTEGNYIDLKFNRSLRDPSAWMHLVIAVDTTQTTASNRTKIYINGVQETSFATATYPVQNHNLDFSKSGIVQQIGAYENTVHFDGSMAHVHFIDGLQYQASDFGETDSTSGIWKAKTSPSVTYGNNGFFLKFENSGAMGTDSSGESNTFAVGGGTLTQNVDTPDNNFATINPLYYSSTGLLNGNITATSTGNSHKNYHSTIAVDSGKWYAEMKVNSWNGSNNIMFGIVADSWNNINSTSPGDNFAGNASTGIGYGSNGQKIIANSASSYGNSFTTGDILGIALDLTNNKLYFSKNGTYQNSGVPTSGSTGTGAIDVPSGFTRLITFSHYGSQSCSMNFGNGYFGTTAVASANADGNGVGKMEYAVPTGYYTLNTKNIKEFG